MEYFAFIRKIKTFSILSVISPLIAFVGCLFLFWFFSTLNLSRPLIDYDKDRLELELNKDIDLDKYIFDNEDHIDKSLFTYTNCPKYMLDMYGISTDGNEVLRDDDKWNTKEKNFFKKNNLTTILLKRTAKINESCVKNYPVINKVLLTFPTLERILIKGFILNTYGFTKIKNPFLYGEVSISRTARYYPANFIFKPLVMLAGFFLIIYWVNNYKVFISKKLNITKQGKSFFYCGIFSALFLILHAIFLGNGFDNDVFQFFRKMVIVLFIIFEVTAQILLTRCIYINRDNLKKIIRYFILKLKILYVISISFLTLISFSILIFFDPENSFKNILEWNYFIGLLAYYILSNLLWKTDKN
jgi:hypothetical protein